MSKNKHDSISPKLAQALFACGEFELMLYFCLAKIQSGAMKQRTGQFYVELQKRGLVEVRKVGKRSYAVPTESACGLLGLPREQAVRVVQGHQLDLATATLVFAAFSDPPLMPMHYADFKAIYGRDVADSVRNTKHLVAKDGLVYRLYLCSAADTVCISQLKAKAEKLHPLLKMDLEGGRYRFAALVETPSKLGSLSRRVAGDAQLSAYVSVCRSATFRSLSHFLKDQRDAP